MIHTSIGILKIISHGEIASLGGATFLHNITVAVAILPKSSLGR